MKKVVAWNMGAALILALSACAPPPKKSAHPDDRVDASGRAPARVSLETEAEVLLSRFEKAVLGHDTSTVVDLLDAHYRSRELDDLSQGNPAAFLNNFICGQVVDQDQHYCLVFKDIIGMQRMGLEFHPDEITAHYFVKSTAHEIRTKLTVAVRKTYSFGVIGSKGFTQVE
jgi:hypothetical protein